MDRALFGRLAVDEMRAAHPKVSLTYDEDKGEILVRTEDGFTQTVILENAWREHEAARPEDKKALLARFVRSIVAVDSQESLDEVRVLLVPRIRPRRYFTADVPAQTAAFSKKVGADGVTPPGGPYHVPLAMHLGVGLAIDRPERIEYVMDPSRYGVPAPELDAIALVNLRRMTKRGLEEVRPGVLVGSWGDDYAAERMLLPELWEGLPIEGDPVVFLPGAEAVFVAGSKDERALRIAMSLADERLAKPRPLVGHAFVRRGGEWQIYEDDTDVGAESGSRLAISLADVYAMQREELQHAQEVEDEDCTTAFVAGASGIGSSEDELLVVWSTWCDGVQTWLPRSHYVGIGKLAEGGEPTMVPWRALMDHAGAHLRDVPDVYPPRWETTAELPTGEVMEALRARAVEMSDLVERRAQPTFVNDAKQALRKSLAAKARMPSKAPPAEPPSGMGRWIFRLIVVAVILALWVISGRL